MSDAEWPPADGRAYIRGDLFGSLLVGIAEHYATRHQAMDFTDAVASVFAWLDAKLSINRRFINARRFPTRDKFVAYLKVAVWNVGRKAARRRRMNEEIAMLPANEPIAPPTASAHRLDGVVD